MKKFQEYQVVILALLRAGGLGIYGLSNHLFWDDEAHTALFAQNLSLSGELTAWNGTNLIGHREGVGLDDGLVNIYMPPLQFYVAAIGLSLFENKTFGGRIPFVLVGLPAIPALALWVRKHFNGHLPTYLPAMIAALSPAYLLYIRQCRYYALGVFFTFALFAAWSWCDGSKRVKVVSIITGIMATIGLWFTHYLNAAAALAIS